MFLSIYASTVLSLWLNGVKYCLEDRDKAVYFSLFEFTYKSSRSNTYNLNPRGAALIDRL